jgi:hypothetical protein
MVLASFYTTQASLTGISWILASQWWILVSITAIMVTGIIIFYREMAYVLPRLDRHGRDKR